MITDMERMEQFAYDNGISLITACLPDFLSGFYYSNDGIKTIALSKKLNTTAERIGVLAEELEHYVTTPVDLFYAPKFLRNKFENIARYNAVKKLMPIERLIDAKRRSICDIYELADHLGVTVEFLIAGLQAYKAHYGSSVLYRDFIVYFDPFQVEKVS